MSEFYYVLCPLTAADICSLEAAGLVPLGDKTNEVLLRRSGFLVHHGALTYKWGCIAGTKQVTVEEFILRHKAVDAPALSTPGAKADAGKPDPTLILNSMPRALMALATVGTFGANKYSRDGWLEVPNGEQRYAAAQDRHRFLRCQGEPVDTESGLDHEFHEAWNALAKLELKLRRLEKENV